MARDHLHYSMVRRTGLASLRRDGERMVKSCGREEDWKGNPPGGGRILSIPRWKLLVLVLQERSDPDGVVAVDRN